MSTVSASTIGSLAVSADRQRPSYILVVDDEPVVCEFVGRCLSEHGYAAKHAGSAAEALEVMMSDPAAAVLCDIRLPGQDGLWLADRLHAHWPQVPVVMVTAVDDLQTAQRSRDAGAVDYIQKPIRPERLIEAVRRAMITAETTVPAPPPMATPELPSPVGDEVRRPTASVTVEAEYTLETTVRCPACGERITVLKAVRLIRSRVNFTSTLPRRGRILACPQCLGIVPGELSNF